MFEIFETDYLIASVLVTSEPGLVEKIDESKGIALNEKAIETLNQTIQPLLPTPIATPTVVHESFPLLEAPSNTSQSAVNTETDQFTTNSPLSTIHEDDDLLLNPTVPIVISPPIIDPSMTTKQIRTGLNAYKIVALLNLNLDLIR